MYENKYYFLNQTVLTVVEREEEFMLRKKHDPRGELFGREPEPVVSK